MSDPIEAAFLALQERVQRVLDWVGDCGCTCDAEPDAPLRDHDSLCPGYVEHMLTQGAPDV